MGHGAWRMAHGAWRMVHGAWRMAHGAWCMVHNKMTVESMECLRVYQLANSPTPTSITKHQDATGYLTHH
jgi:hypothetical protein